MFGLMQPDGACHQDSTLSYNYQRMHYCGTCKSIGKHYGQKARLLLNYDAVFLAELLSALSGENPKDWEASLQAVDRCFTLPQKQTQSPIALHYAAAANVLFAKLKLRDNAQDAGHFWTWMGSFFSGNFKKALKELKNWGLDLEKIHQIAASQELREKDNPSGFSDFEQYLAHCAAPAQALTAIVFGQAAIAIGKPELEAALSDFGAKFGTLIYHLDAFEDVEKDAAKKAFNPFLAYFGEEAVAMRNLHLPDLDLARQKAEESLLALPLDDTLKARFAARLCSNMASRSSQLQLSKPKATWQEKLSRRYQFAAEAAARILCEPKGVAGKLQYNLLLFAFFVAPDSAAKNGFSWTSFLATFFTAIGLGWALGKLPRRNKKKKKKKGAPCPDCAGDCSRRCRSQGDSCKKCCMAVLIILGILILIEVGLIIWGILLIIAGHIFWGIFAMLILPIILGIFALIIMIIAARD